MGALTIPESGLIYLDASPIWRIGHQRYRLKSAANMRNALKRVTKSVINALQRVFYTSL